MKRPWTDDGLELGCEAPRADASSAATDVTNRGAHEPRDPPAQAVAAS